MKTRFAVLLTAAVALPAFAHDPSQHKPGDAKDPDCAQMDHMDMSKMDPKDPVMKAMHDKCMATMKHDHDGHDKKPEEAKETKPGSDKPNPHEGMNHGAM